MDISRVDKTGDDLLHSHQTLLLAASPLPENVGAALELLLPLALNLEVVADEGDFLLLGEVLAPSEVVGELAAAELHGVGARKVGATGGQPLLVVQLLVGLALLEVLIEDRGLGRPGGGRDGEDGRQAEQSGAAALGRGQLHPLRRR